jgi:hypothetical protein
VILDRQFLGPHLIVRVDATTAIYQPILSGSHAPYQKNKKEAQKLKNSPPLWEEDTTVVSSRLFIYGNVLE